MFAASQHLHGYPYRYQSGCPCRIIYPCYGRFDQRLSVSWGMGYSPPGVLLKDSRLGLLVEVFRARAFSVKQAKTSFTFSKMPVLTLRQTHTGYERVCLGAGWQSRDRDHMTKVENDVHKGTLPLPVATVCRPHISWGEGTHPVHLTDHCTSTAHATINCDWYLRSARRTSRGVPCAIRTGPNALWIWQVAFSNSPFPSLVVKPSRARHKTLNLPT